MAVQVICAPGASGVDGHTAGESEPDPSKAVSSIETFVTVTLPVLVTMKE